MHRNNIDFAVRSRPLALVVLDRTVYALGEAAVDFHHTGYQGRIKWPKEHARRRRGRRAVHLIEAAVAEYAMAIQVVSDGEVERLVEVVQPFWTAGGDRNGENG